MHSDSLTGWWSGARTDARQRHTTCNMHAESMHFITIYFALINADWLCTLCAVPHTQTRCMGMKWKWHNACRAAIRIGVGDFKWVTGFGRLLSLCDGCDTVYDWMADGYDRWLRMAFMTFRHRKLFKASRSLLMWIEADKGQSNVVEINKN